jgi:capsule polysaccharide export protein KpsE/RkpR
VSQIGTKPQVEDLPSPIDDEMGEEESFGPELNARLIARLRLLWAERALLGKATLAGLVIGLVIAFLIPTRYDSTVQLMPPDNQSSSGMMMLGALASKGGAGGGGGLGAVAGDLLGMKSSGALFVGVLGSRTVQDRLIERFDLRKVYWVRYDEDARKKLLERTNVAEDRKSGIISITVTDRDPKRAAAIAQAYVEELNQLVAELSTSAAHRERVFLEERLRAVKLDLDDASQKFSQFASKNTAIDIKDQGRAMVEAAATLQGQMIAAQSELKGLEEIYSSNNVRVRSVQARIAELNRQLQKIGGSDSLAADQSKSPDSLYPSIRELPLLGVTWSDLYRRTKIQETVYETLTQQYELAKVQEAKETPSVKVLDAARVPERKSFPPRTLIICTTAFAFLGLAAFWIVGRSRWDETDATDPTKLFAQEVFHDVNQHMPWAGSREPGIETSENGSGRRVVPGNAGLKKPESSAT